MALLYFEVVSTLALLIGLLVGNAVHPGSGFNVDVATLHAKSVADYAGQARVQTVTDFLMHIIPTTVFGAFAKGNILRGPHRNLVWLRSSRRRTALEATG